MPTTAPRMFEKTYKKMTDQFEKKTLQNLRKLNNGRLCSPEHPHQTKEADSRYGLLFGQFQTDVQEFRSDQALIMKGKKKENNVDSEDSCEEVRLQTNDDPRILNEYTNEVCKRMIFFDKQAPQNIAAKFATTRSPMYNNKTSRRIYERAVLQKKTKAFEYSGAPCMIKDRKKFSNIMLTHDKNIREDLRTFNPSPVDGL